MGGTDLVLGTLTGTGTLNPDTGGFAGIWASTPAGRINGNFGGRFFGPQGREFGYAFSLIGQGDGGQMFTAAGASYGAR